MSPFIPVLSKTHLEIRFSRHVPTWKKAPSQLGLFLLEIRATSSLFWFRSSRLPIITIILLWAISNVVLRIKQDIAREWIRRITASHSSFIHLYHLPFLAQHWHNSATGLLWPLFFFLEELGHNQGLPALCLRLCVPQGSFLQSFLQQPALSPHLNHFVKTTVL